MSINWRVFGEDTFAAKLDKAEFPGFFSKKITLGPNEGAVVYKDGKVDSVLTEGTYHTASLWERVKGWFGAPTEVQVVSFRTTPFTGHVFLGINETDSDRTINRQALTLDGAKLIAECEYTLSIPTTPSANPDRLLGQHEAIATWSICGEVGKLLFSRVLQPMLARVRLDEIRGNTELIAKLETEARIAVAQRYAESGLQLDTLRIIWGLSDEEAAALKQREQKLAEDAAAFEHQLKLNQEERNLELARTRLVNGQEYKVLQEKGEQELARLHLEGAIELDALKRGRAIDVAEVDAQLRRIHLEIEKHESNVKLEIQRAEQNQRLDLQERESRRRLAEVEAKLKLEQGEMEQMVNLQIKMKAEKHLREIEAKRLEIDAEFNSMRQMTEERLEQRRMKLDETKTRMASIEGIMKNALSAGAVTPDVMKTFLEQATEQEYATSSDEMVKARSQANAAKHNVETYQAAQAAEREHQVHITQQAANLMQAAKQPSGPTIVSATPVQPSALACPHCGAQVKAHWKACPECGTTL